MRRGLAGEATMKRAGIGAGIATLILGAAAPVLGDTTPASAERTFVYCSEGNPDYLNPQLTTSEAAAAASRPIYETLVRLSPDGARIDPGLAES
jgi:dipeptide transport system substrate-binding protein